MTISLVAIAAVLMWPIGGQIVGQTCSSQGCNPIFSALPPMPTPIIRNAQIVCGIVTADVTLLNETDSPLMSNSWINVEANAQGRVVNTSLEADSAPSEILPGRFVRFVHYRGRLPTDLSGLVELRNGSNPAIRIAVHTVIGCK